MTKKQFRTRLVVLSLLVVLLIGLIGVASGKYTTTISHRGKITFSASLAESVTIQETTGTEYLLIPGHDITKDPKIVITGKTTIPAYLFVEVVDKLDTNLVEGETKKPVSYSMATGWTELEGITGADGSKVYYYNTVLTNTNVPGSIGILNGNIVTVSQDLLSQSDDDGEDVLKFNVKLIEKVGDADAIKAYGGYKTTND